jgi:AAA domain
MKCIVVSGLPGSGKSTLARQLAPRLAMSVLDKDDILDALFDTLGTGDAAWRTKLSRTPDDVFCRIAPGLADAMLVSWWRHPNATGESGTPTTWLASLHAIVLEVHCVCPAELAAARFAERRRHAGHLDAARDVATLQKEFEQLARLGPIGCGRVLDVSTGSAVNVDDVASRIGRYYSDV